MASKHWADIERAKARLRQRRRQFFAALVLECYRRVVLRTPVLTGRARGNWWITEGEAAEGTKDRLDPTGAESLAEAAAFAKSLTGEDVVFIVNNLPYIRPLEKGHSKQAPQGMVAITLAEVKLIAQEMLRVIKTESDRIATMEASANG